MYFKQFSKLSSLTIQVFFGGRKLSLSMILNKIFLIFEDLSLDNSYKTNSYNKYVSVFSFSLNMRT